ncbi:glycosyltransferase family 2 protein [Parasediminibacterium sp. JCM 36343]|uniref:glycosyltransferase family 2 protein n=1 Tax=Parasediminibacterium sp. JCM 36343 TaxID=3374279 RepID=UPI00397B4F44
MQLPLDVTIAIPVRNEAKNLPKCLEAIGKGFVKEIIIIDSSSSDDTPAIAKAFGATFINFEWDGKFPKKRNWLLRNYAFISSWILFLDADEYLTEDFKKELAHKIADANANIAGYWLKYNIYFMGKKLKGGYPLNKLALFKIGSGEYERIDEDSWSKLDMEIHEHPIIQGKTAAFSSKIDHQDYRGINHYILKHNDYAAWEAKRFVFNIKGSNQSNFTYKQKLKYKLMQSVAIGILFFFGSYILMGGFRDGKRGFVFAIFKMSYFLNIYCRIKELTDVNF